MIVPEKASGFTLLEVMVVVALLAVGAAVAVWSVNLILPDLRLKAAARDLKSDLHMARLSAIRRNTHIVSEFNADHNTYTIYVDDGGGDGAKANNYFHDEEETTLKSVRIHPHVHIFKAKFGAVTGRFAFNGRGTIEGLAGGVYMENTKMRYRGVAVSRIGKISIKSSVDGSNWHGLH